MLRTSVLVTGVVGAIGASANAMFVTGATAFFTGAISTRNDKAGSAPGTYSASVTSTTPSASASATLVWGAASYAFSGTASGAAGTPAPTFANSQGIARYTFTEAMNVQINWDLSNVVGLASSGGSVGWTITDSLGNFAYAIVYFAGSPTPNVEGGVPQISSQAGFIGQLGPGTWTVSTSVSVEPPASGTAPGGGAFSVSMNFTPAPGALPLVAIASIVARRGRRRCLG